MKAATHAYTIEGKGYASFSLAFTPDEVSACSHSGDCLEGVRAVVRDAQGLSDIPQDLIREALKPYGAWDEYDMEDEDANLERLVWVAACDCRDSGELEWMPG